MSSAKTVDMRSKREVLRLIEALALQGCRVEWGSSRGGSNVAGHFPAKVYPPDPTRHFILFHGTASDRNATVLKRNEVRRAGLTWPGDAGPKNTDTDTTTTEDQMTSTGPTMSTSDRKAGEHLVTPPGVLSQSKPSRRTVEAFRPVLELLPPVFWTDVAADGIRTLNVPGYAKGTDSTRIQLMLDWYGYRVINTKPNRNGLSYQWAREGVERQDVSQRGGALSAVPPLPEQPVDLTTDVLSSEMPVPEAPLPATPGPIAAAFAEAEEKRQRKHKREQCPNCGRTYTPEGLAHHYEETDHGPKPKTSQVVVNVEPVDPAEPVITTEMVEGEQRDEAAEWRALIEEAEAETARVREELRAMVEDRDAERERGNRQATLLTQRKADLDQAQATATRAQQARDEAIQRLEAQPIVDNGSWEIDPANVDAVQVGNMIRDAAKLGVAIRILGRRA